MAEKTFMQKYEEAKKRLPNGNVLSWAIAAMGGGSDIDERREETEMAIQSLSEAAPTAAPLRNIPDEDALNDLYKAAAFGNQTPEDFMYANTPLGFDVIDSTNPMAGGPAGEAFQKFLPHKPKYKPIFKKR